VLATDTESPVVTETTVGTDLLQALEIITELGVNTVGENLAVLAIDDIALTIEEPGWDLVLGGVLDDGDDPLELFGGEFTSALVQVDISLLSTRRQDVSSQRREVELPIHSPFAQYKR